ncbi:aminotransferase class V-fold PLP-dependent enzyme [Micromonospora sp. NPDC047707]|uniref:aminotransferase class V-fold PLP-dependent enzyme n=1 Tax=Micromonospora sp. NPDC047707 TaxID=3154498 RepID=UPI0034566530
MSTSAVALDDLHDQFLLDPSLVHLNHGGFGACPRPVFDAHQRWQRDLERHPSALLSHGYGALMEGVRERLAEFLGCAARDVVLVQNTTAGLNAVARSLRLRPGDEVLATDHEYEAMDLLWQHVCADTGARYIRHRLPLPVEEQGDLVEALWSAVGPATRVIFLSHITSKTAITLPVAEICRRARAAGIMTVVDGAHAPGQLPLQLDALGADVYAASCHKWLCGPRGTGFLYVRPEYQSGILAPLISHGSQPGSTFLDRHRWQGTRDPSAFLALPTAIDCQQTQAWEAARRRSHELARAARAAVSGLFHLEPFTPDSDDWFVQMVSVPLPPCDSEAMRRRLLTEHRVDAPVRDWADGSLIRVSVHAYNTSDDLGRLVDALGALFTTPRAA